MHADKGLTDTIEAWVSALEAERGGNPGGFAKGASNGETKELAARLEAFARRLRVIEVN
jgi:hypothetical protein